MIINHNIAALNTLNQLSMNTKNSNNALAKLSSGKRINSAADDAAGLAISEKMKGQINGLDQAQRNSQDGISLIQTAEGALNETQSMLQRMRELSVQASNDTNTSSDRTAIQSEVNQLTQQIDTIANDTQFNNKNLLNGNIGVRVGDGSVLSSVNTTAQTAKGTYTIDATAATAATAATTGALDVSSNTTAGEVQGSGTLTINGVDITVAANTKLSDLASTINSSVSGVQATYDSTNNKFTIATTDTGANTSLNISEGSDNIISADATEAYKTAALAATGTNLTGVSVNGPSGPVVAADITYNNNTVSIVSGEGQGMTATVLKAGAAGDTSSVDVNGSLSFQIGANQGQTMNISINSMDSTSLGVNNLDMTSTTGAENAITSIDNAIQSVSAQRASLGAYQNRLDHTINNLSTSSQNLTSADSSITDVDMAKEMMTYTKDNILEQAAQSMLSKANQAPQGILQLLR